MDTLLCSDKEDAKNAIDNIGGQFVDDWEFLENGNVRLYLKEGWKNNEQSD